MRVWSEAPKQEAKPAGGQPVISEDVLARLQAAEEEAARLRKQLADAQTKVCRIELRCKEQTLSPVPAAVIRHKLHSSPLQTGTKAAELVDGKPRRIDSTDNRETILPLGGE